VSVLNNGYARVLTIVLLIQAALFYGVASRAERIPSVTPLAAFPHDFGGWRMIQDVAIDPDQLEVLKADDTLNRVYASPSQGEIFLFAAFFKTQRYGQSPHSPKNCLPGNGWEPVEAGLETINVPGRAAPIVTNRFVVQHGEAKEVVLYWYQSHNRVIASEFSAHFWLVADAIRYHRSDTALIRIVVPVRDNDIGAATRTGAGFVRILFPELLKQLPA